MLDRSRHATWLVSKFVCVLRHASSLLVLTSSRTRRPIWWEGMRSCRKFWWANHVIRCCPQCQKIGMPMEHWLLTSILAPTIELRSRFIFLFDVNSVSFLTIDHSSDKCVCLHLPLALTTGNRKYATGLCTRSTQTPRHASNGKVIFDPNSLQGMHLKHCLCFVQYSNCAHC